MNHNLNVGDRVRVRYGNHAGEIATVADITWHSNQFGTYARVHVCFKDGQTDARGMDSLEKVKDEVSRTAHPGH